MNQKKEQPDNSQSTIYMIPESFQRVRPVESLIATESPKPLLVLKSFDFQCASPPENLSATELYSYATKNYTRSSRIQQKGKKNIMNFSILYYSMEIFSRLLCFGVFGQLIAKREDKYL